MSSSSISRSQQDIKDEKETRKVTTKLASAISTKNILSDFPRTFSDQNSTEALDKQRKLHYYNTLDEHQRTVLRRLQKWTAQPLGLVNLLMFRRTQAPGCEELISLITHYFPPRGETIVQVFDFGDEHATRTKIQLGDVEQAMQSKPDWASVRWIHAPLGIGLFHSSVEALFFHSGNKIMGREFESAGRGGWPYLETELLNVRSLQDFTDSGFIAGLSRNKELARELDQLTFRGDNNKTLRSDIEWRADHVGTDIGYWKSVGSDMPWQLSEGSALYMNGTFKGNRTSKLDIDRQSLARHPFFEKVQLVRDPFRTFHRSDGYLLTLCPAVGIDYLDKDMPQHLSNSKKCLHDNEQASAVAHIFKQFEGTGISTWHRKTVEWLLVYIMTEIGGTPHNNRKGYNCPSIMDAYDVIVHELKERRYEPWKRNKSPQLVRAYLSCIDELATLGTIFTQKVDLFTRVEEDCVRFKKEDNVLRVNNPKGETAQQRVQFALHMAKETREHTQRLIIDLTESVNTFFQLRSLEQNELAIVSDSQSNAIFIFTGMTIVFLALLFFPSYFGMNLDGVINTQRTERYCWEVCGTLSVTIVGIASAVTFRRRTWVRFNKMNPRDYMMEL